VRREVEKRVIAAAKHILKTDATVRACAAQFGVSKTTIHKDMRERLPAINPALAGRVDAVLKKNMEQRQIRVGEATKNKYEKKKATGR